MARNKYSNDSVFSSIQNTTPRNTTWGPLSSVPYGEAMPGIGQQSNVGAFLDYWGEQYGPPGSEGGGGWNWSADYEPPYGTNVTEFNEYIQELWQDYLNDGNIPNYGGFPDFFEEWYDSILTGDSWTGNTDLLYESAMPGYQDWWTWYNSQGEDYNYGAPGPGTGTGGGAVGGAGDLGYGNMFLGDLMTSCSEGPIYGFEGVCIACCP